MAKNTGRGSVVGNNAPDKDKFVKAKSVGGRFGKPISWSEKIRKRFFGRISCPMCLGHNIESLDDDLGIDV